MNAGRTIFAQLIEFLPHKEFQKCVVRYCGDANPRGFTCWDQFLAMIFAQLTYRESLRDIEASLGAIQAKLYHMGFRGRVRKSTLADANDTHDWRIYADFAQVLIAQARLLYATEPMGIELDQSLYALDSSTIDLCLSLFPWARFRRHKAAVKMHTLLDLRGNIPTFIHITDGKVHDVNVLDLIQPEAGAFYVMDRGYIDFERLYRFKLELAFFRRAHQEQRASPAPLLASCGEGIRCALGSDRRARVVRNGFGLSIGEVRQCVEPIERTMTLLPDNVQVYSAWRRLIVDYNVHGVQVHDVRLAAIMQVYGVPHILTFNQADFMRYTHLQAIHPSHVTR